MKPTHFVMKWFTVVGLLVFFTPLRVNGQFEDLQGCVSNCRFIPLITGCMAEKFLIMLNLPPLSTECPNPSTASAEPQVQQHRAAEAPAGHAGVKLANPTLRSGYLDDVALRHAQRKQQTKLSDQTFKFIDNFLSKTSLFQSDTPVLDNILKTRSVPSLESIMLDTIEPLKEEAYRFRQTLMEAQEVMLSMSQESNDGEASQSWRQTRRTTLEELQRILTCFRSYDETAYEDGLSWTKCLFICRDLPLLSTCMAEAFTQIDECNRTMWLKDLVLSVFTDFLDLENCYFEIQSPTVEEQPIMLEEGGAPATVQFITYLPPGVYCWPPNPLSDMNGVARGVISNVFKLNPPCTVEVQLTTSNYIYDTLPYVRSDLISGLDMGRPKCRNGSAINQVAIGWHQAASNSAGIISLSEQNWNQTFSIPLSAVIDYKLEDDQYLNVSFTMKLVVDGNTVNTTKLPMEIHDRDPTEISNCYSFNDPHIVTFDGLYYNNFFHGYFQMYKHQELPYEVQVAYQACDGKTNESCTCAAAVKSGDDVFVVDRCRHLASDCTTADCTNVQKVTLYLNDVLTPGTDIYKLDGGISYMVSLPHGTLVKIVTNREMLNVYITPSPYDLNNTLGLCGTFNEHRNDDLTLSDGTIVNIGDTLQPTPFIESWRLMSNETIFEGSLASDVQYNFGNYCQCSHYFMDNAQCICSYSELRQTCDLDLDNKFNQENITSIVRQSKKASMEEAQDTRDMDINYLPNENITFDDNVNWTRVDSISYCQSMTVLDGKQHIQDCKSPELIGSDFLSPVNNAYYGCMDDMAILDETNEAWSMSYLETMKYGCLQRVHRSSGIEARSWLEYVNETCINDCSQHGFCVYGKCECGTGYAGSDCSILDIQPPVIVMDSSNLCDSRHENCSYSTVYGQNFTDDNRITCRATPRKAYDTEKLPDTKVVEVEIILISSDQIACVLPRSGSFSIEILWQGSSLPLTSTSSAVVRATGPFEFKAYDSACYTCSPSQDLCTLKSDDTYCIISNVCYADMQPNPLNDCQICNITYSMNSFFYKTDETCAARRLQEEKQKADDKRHQDIRIGVSVGLSGLVVIITIIMLVFSRRSDKNSSISFSSNTSSRSSSKGSRHSSSSGVDVSSSSNPPAELKTVENNTSTAAPVFVARNDSGVQSFGNLVDSEQNSGSENSAESMSTSSQPMPSNNARSDSAAVPSITVVMHDPPGYESDVTDGMRSEQKSEPVGKPLYPRVLLIGGENVQNGSLKSLSKVPMVRERTSSTTSSAKSVGIGAGPPIQYYLNRHPSSASSAAVKTTNVRL